MDISTTRKQSDATVSSNPKISKGKVDVGLVFEHNGSKLVILDMGIMDEHGNHVWAPFKACVLCGGLQIGEKFHAKYYGDGIVVEAPQGFELRSFENFNNVEILTKLEIASKLPTDPIGVGLDTHRAYAI